MIDWNVAENCIRSFCGLGNQITPIAGNISSDYDTLLNKRRRVIGPSLSLSYQKPLVITHGNGQFLYEPNGRAYLDCVNNVPHVGHCHPKVNKALSDQAERLNTNTRYLHPNLVEYAERLTATFPAPLKVCYFVNSGSEANELAIRLARTHTSRRDIIVLEGAYHGNTSTLIEISPYKSEGPGGKGLPDWVHKVPKPDPYNGLHWGVGKEIGRLYGDYVLKVCERLAAEGRPPALFLCESILGCAGQIVLPEGYLEATFEHVRSVGGVCIVDEVQVGMGRVGTHMWAFETQNVIPDIVTLGKPIGNGHPIGAVVTTLEIAHSFDNGMEFFSTFGGNPVSCAVGLSVLDVIEEEKLLAHALRIGDYLTMGFQKLAERHEVIGDVRGLGLFMGIELVADRQSRLPATELTSRLIETVKADGILLSAEGPGYNVLKIKPPLKFSEVDADLLLGSVDRALYILKDLI